MFVFNNETTAEKLDDKSSRKVLAHDGSLMMVEVSFLRGGIGSAHTHPHEQITYVAKGSFEFDVDGDIKTVTQGDSVYIPSDALHGVKALEDGVLVDIFTPQREDFLKNK